MSESRNPLESEARRIASELAPKIVNDYEWRMAQAEQWGWVRAHIEAQTAINERTERWQKEHQTKDDENITGLYRHIDAKVGNVSSGVNDGERKFSKLDGVKIGVGIAASFFLTVGGCIWAVFTFFSNKP